MMEGVQIDIWRPLAGLMIFLLAMSLIESAIKSLAGHKVKDLIAKNTERPLPGILSGTVATALLQSSSLVGLLVLAFVGARIMSLKQALLSIFGANLGTTATGWLVALLGFKLNLDAISLPLIAISGLCYTAFKQGAVRNYGQLGLGIGLLLLALQFMKSALGDANSAIDPGVLAGFELWQYALFGVLASALMQSSSAVMVLTLSALNSNIIELHAAAALMVGADLGTTTTIIFGAIGGTANKKRVALGHVIFNAVTDALAFIFLTPLVAVVAYLSDPLLSLVAFHSLFNIAGVCMWTPLVSRLANQLERMFERPTTFVNRFLDPATLAIEESALAALAQELDHLSDRVVRQNAGIFHINVDRIPTKDDYRVSYRSTKQLEAEILEYALALRFAESTSDESQRLDHLLEGARNLLLSSKLCKDNLNDLRDLADYQPELFSKVVTTQHDFYSSLPPTTDLACIDADKRRQLIEQNDTGHDKLHELIYVLIKDDQLPASKISTILNLNRGFFNSNNALLYAIGLLSKLQPSDPTRESIVKGQRPVSEEVAHQG